MTSTSRARSFAALFACAAGLLLSGTAYAQAVTSCGQQVGGGAFLAGDLDCSAATGPAITLTGGTLDLRGFTLTGGSGAGVQCLSACRVVSDPPGGTITGSAGPAVSAYLGGTDSAKVSVEDILLLANQTPGSGAAVDGGPVRLRRVTIDGSGASGVLARYPPRMRLDEVTISGSGTWGVILGSAAGSAVKRSLRATNVTITGGAGAGIDGGSDSKMKIDGALIQGVNGRGILAEDAGLRLRDAVVAGNAASGVQIEGPNFLRNKVRVRDSIVADNGEHGLWAGKVRMVDTDCTGNGRHGVVSTTTKIRGGSFSGNGERGIVSAIGARVRGVTATGNGRAGINVNQATATLTDVTALDNANDASYCASSICADITTAFGVIKLGGTSTCETSYNTLQGVTLGLCSLD